MRTVRGEQKIHNDNVEYIVSVQETMYSTEEDDIRKSGRDRSTARWPEESLLPFQSENNGLAFD